MAAAKQRSDLETLVDAIARSQIVIARVLARSVARRRLPAGFEAVDVAILDWIAAEGRRASRSFLRL
jgi:hypothetical protein